MNRKQIRDRFLAVRERGEFLVGAAVGSGLFAEAAEQGGADFVLALGAGRLRLMGAASIACMLPIRDSNAFVERFGPGEFLNRCSVPAFFGASVLTPGRSAADIVDSIAELGFHGVMNFPSVVDYPPEVQPALDACGLGFGKELELFAEAQRHGLWSVAHVRTREQARMAAAGGVDMVCLVFGWNSGGRRGMASPVTLQEAALVAREVGKAVQRENPDAFLVLEGGPIESMDDLTPICRTARIEGYIGGSTLDRMPLEDAVVNQTVRFKAAAAAARAHSEQERGLLAFGRSHGFAGGSRKALVFYASLRQLARSYAHPAFLVCGESGTERQRVAEALFRTGGGDPGELMTIDAAEMSAQRLLIALFGHARMDKARGTPQGAVGRASGLVIRGLESVSAHNQRRIARFLARERYRPVGGKREQRGSLRVLFISEKPLQALVTDGLVHPELQQLLVSHEVCVPPLRERVEDIQALLADMLESGGEDTHAKRRLSPAALRRLQVHDWPGNLAELRTLAAKLAALPADGWVDERAVTALLHAGNEQVARPASERDLILDAMWRHGFRRGATARFLGISRKTLYNKIKRYKLRG
jgi:predicted TIM-barrel enzyme/DNA-binding NtrC family response regulator